MCSQGQSQEGFERKSSHDSELSKGAATIKAVRFPLCPASLVLPCAVLHKQPFLLFVAESHKRITMRSMSWQICQGRHHEMRNC